MSRSTVCRVFCLCVLGSVARAADPAPVASRVSAVTVYADRAQVTRTAEAALKPGLQTLAFAELPGWIDEDSVRVALAPETAGRIADVRVRRDYVSRDADAERRGAAEAVQELEDQAAALDDELKAIEQQAAQVAEVKVFSLEKLPRDAVLAGVDVRSYGQAVEFVGDQARRLAAARREVAKRRRTLEPELDLRRRRLAGLEQRGRLEQRTVLVAVDAAAAGAATLRLTYLLPGATWEPAHELRAEAREPREVTLTSYAVVTQTTGEEWTEAVLSFSTQSPGEVARIPELTALLVGVGGPAQPAAAPASFAKAQRLHLGQNEAWFNARNPGDSIEVYTANGTRQADIQSRTLATFAQLKDRGTSYHFAGQVPLAVRSDGAPVRVPIGHATLAATCAIVAAPEISLNAARVLRLVNSGGQPLLPGRVALYHEGAFLGLTDTGFVAENESCEVLLGVADQVKLARVLDRKASSLRRGSRTRLQVAFDVLVENLAGEPVEVRLFDRVPVSEDRDVRVSDVEVAPACRPDNQGMLRWTLKLPAGGRQACRIAYTVEYPPAVLRSARQTNDEGLAAPAAADLYIQLHSLESKF